MALVYAAPGLAVLLALTERPAAMSALLAEMLPFLPRRFHAHLSHGLAPALAGAYRVESHGDYTRMVLTDPAGPRRVDTSACEPLAEAQVGEVTDFYRGAYPGNWFDPAMLATGQYFGIRRNGKLVAVSGVHVFSERYRVAALGNIATHPGARGQGLGTAVTARTCISLFENVDVIGLNVKSDNAAAIACYAKLGFTPRATFEELMFT